MKILKCMGGGGRFCDPARPKTMCNCAILYAICFP